MNTDESPESSASFDATFSYGMSDQLATIAQARSFFRDLLLDPAGNDFDTNLFLHVREAAFAALDDVPARPRHEHMTKLAIDIEAISLHLAGFVAALLDEKIQLRGDSLDLDIPAWRDESASETCSEISTEA